MNAINVCGCGGRSGGVEQPCPWRVMSDHLFIPRKLAFIYSEEAGQLLGNQFIDYTEKSDIQHLSKTLKLFMRCSNNAPELQLLLDAVKVPGFLMAVPLMDHNAVVLFNNKLQGSDNGRVLVSALDVLPHPESIHSESADANPYPSGCKLVIPRRTVIVPAEEVTSAAFLEQLAALGRKAEYPLREQKARKAGHEVTETRKPAIPIYVFDWLMNTMQIAHSSMEPEVFSKSIRLDSVRRSKAEKPWTRSATWVALKSVVHLILVQLHGFQLGTQIYKCHMLMFQSSFVRKLLQLHQSGKCRRDFGELREMCAHLSKKAAKLQRFFPSCHETLKEAYDTCQSVDQVVTAEWTRYLQLEKLNNQIDIESLGRIDFSDTWNPLTSARPALTEALRTDSVLESTRCRTDRYKSIPMIEVSVKQEHLGDDSLKFNPRPWMEKLIADLAVGSSDYLERALQVVETFIRLHLWPHLQSAYSDVESLLAVSERLLLTYHQKCTQRYQGDAVRLSKMILHCCTLVAWMDAVCVRWDPLQFLGSHQLFIIDPIQLHDLLLMDAVDVQLLQKVSEYVTNRTARNLKPGFMDVSESGLANCYASQNSAMLSYEQRYFEEDRRLRREKEEELEDARRKYRQLQWEANSMTCTCYTDTWYDRGRCKSSGKCWYQKRMDEVEHSVSIYERRLPDDSVKRRSIIFHHLMPMELVHLMESCSFVVSICAVEMGFPPFPGSPYTWDEINYTRRIALGSNTKSFLNTHYGKKPSILTSDSNFIVPQGKNVQLLFKQSHAHGYASGTFSWNLTRYCQLAVGSPFHNLSFAVHGTSHTENDILAMQYLCPTDVELTSWNDFGSVRAGGYLQWRNMAAVFEGSTLELDALPVAMLFLQAAYQVGPLPADQHWNFDLSETSFVRLLFDHVELAVERIRDNWSAHRALFICISICIYVVQRVSPEMAERGRQVLELCRQISRQWSEAVERVIAADASKSVVDEDNIRALFYVNSLIVLTFKFMEQPTSEELFQLLRARTIMYEKRYLPRDEELERVASLCSRIMASHEQLIHRLLIVSDCSPVTLVAGDRWPQGRVSSWTQCGTSDFYQSTCSTEYSTLSVIHFNVFDGTFLVDGEPIGRLSDGILEHQLFEKNFPSASLPVLHRGGGV
jgi:hypothetical protein